MHRFFRPLFISGLIATAAVWVVPRFFLKHLVGEKEFRTAAEAKVEEFLQAKVRIRHIHVGRLNEIDLSGLEIEPRLQPAIAYQVEVKKIIFQYDFFQLLVQKIRGPKAVILQSPYLRLKDSIFPYEVFRNFEMGSSRSNVSSLQLKGGKIQTLLKPFSKELFLNEIEGRFDSMGSGKVKVDFSANAEGFMKGKIKVHGMIDVLHQTHDLKLQLHAVNVGDSLALPFGTLQGSLRWINDEFIIEDIATQVHGWDSKLQGRISNLGQQAFVDIKLISGKKDFQVEIPLKMDFQNGLMETGLSTAGYHYTLKGPIQSQGMKIRSEKLVLNDTYHGSGTIDFNAGDVKLRFENGNQRFAIASNLKNTDMVLNVKLDHAKWWGMDVVTQGQARLTATPFLGEDRLWKFHSQFETDYFILEYTPFENFQGSFDLDQSGVTNLMSSWGNAFTLSGSINFSEPPSAHLSLKVNDFNLDGIRSFGAKPLPKNLGGVLSGKLKIDGVMGKPEVSGLFSIKDGILSELEYDKAQIQFEGTPPVLNLTDSKILKGRTKLNLLGSINLSLSNILEPIEIQTFDKMVLWKGLQLNATQQNGQLEISTDLSKRFPMLALKAGYTSGEYASSKDNQFQDEGYIATGPHIKF